MSTKIGICTVLALVLHLAFGWLATIVAGFVAGVWIGQRGWRIGAGVGMAGWLVLVFYNFIVAPGPVWTMAQTMGGIFGNLPGWLVVAVTLLIGAVLGGLGGYLGSTVRQLLSRRHAPVSV